MNPQVTTEMLLEQTHKLAILAREEDLGGGDITSRLMADNASGEFNVVARQPCVIAGQMIAQTILDVYEDSLIIDWSGEWPDGARVASAPQTVAIVGGPVQAVLAAERVLLNFLQRLCGVATMTRRFVDAVKGTGACIMDTRKTTPGWRLLEKYAVRSGGGRNHRMGLFDAVLIKDNHLAGASESEIGGTVFEMLNQAASLENPPAFVEVEADTLQQVERLFDVVGVEVILLDNFSIPDLRAAVEMRASRNLTDRIKLEASGGVTQETVRSIAETGVDFISVGAITHSAPAVDLALDRSM